LQLKRVRELLASGLSIDFICSLTGWGPISVRQSAEKRQ
jgi:hypothetical protein